MKKKRDVPVDTAAADGVEFVLDNDLGEMFHNAEVVRERRPAKIVTAVRLDLDTPRPNWRPPRARAASVRRH
jgi:hypothetical protein